MTPTQSTIPLKYVKQLKKLEYLARKKTYSWQRFEKDDPNLTIADVIDSNLLTDKSKRELLDACIADWHIESISKLIIWKIKKIKENI